MGDKLTRLGSPHYPAGMAGVNVVLGAQLKAARALAGWSQGDLAERSGVGRSTIRNFEAGQSTPQLANLQTLQRTLEAAGVEFTNGDAPGVRCVGPPRDTTA